MVRSAVTVKRERASQRERYRKRGRDRRGVRSIYTFSHQPSIVVQMENTFARFISRHYLLLLLFFPTSTSSMTSTYLVHMKEKECRFASMSFYFIAEETHATSSTKVGEYLGCQGIGAAGFLVVLPSQSRHDDGQELLEGGLDLRGELVAHLGGDDDGQAVRQQLQTEKRGVNAIRT